jgi:DNA-binding IscR family transcriptional regulator
MSIEGISDRANKVYKAMKDANIITEEKMTDAERITQISKMPKNFVLNCLQELQNKGYVKRKAREKAAGYYISQVV